MGGWGGALAGESKTIAPPQAAATATGTEAACSNVTLSGFMTNIDSGAQTYSAKAPWRWTQTLAPEACGSLIHAPNTSSPGLNSVTFPNRLNSAGHINAWPNRLRDTRFPQPEHDAQ